MDKFVDTLSPETDIREAVDFMLEKRVTGVLVANSRKQLVGILTEYDCLKLLTLGDSQHEAPMGKVKDFMKCDVHGNVWCTGPGGVWAVDPKGNALGRIRVPEHTANFTWGGDDMKTMFFATRKTIYAATLNTPGIPLP